MTFLLPTPSRLDGPTAERLLATAVANIQRDYPVHWNQLIQSADELVPQRARHPVFAGSYDWHSCVHQTWLTVRLLRLRPDLPSAGAAREVLDGLVTARGCATEAAFFVSRAGKSWERPYGWAWLLLLDAELRRWIDNDSGGTSIALPWALAIRPLADVLRDNWLAWARETRLPSRVGTHTNSAFALGLVLDAARAVGDDELAESCATAARRWYLHDCGYGGFEPSAADFLSPGLTEVDVMRRVLARPAFLRWFDDFLPDLDAARWAVLREPVPTDHPADPHGSHLAGLALSRAWAWRAIADALPAEHRFARPAASAARLHSEAGWTYVFGHGYAAEHWLGTFAGYLEVGALDT